MALENTKDLLYLVLSFCVLGVTIFLCWLLYYLIDLFRQVHSVTKGVESIVEKVESVVDLVKNKVEQSAGYIAVAGEVIRQVIGFVKERRKTEEPVEGEVINREKKENEAEKLKKKKQ